MTTEEWEKEPKFVTLRDRALNAYEEYTRNRRTGEDFSGKNMREGPAAEELWSIGKELNDLGGTNAMEAAYLTFYPRDKQRTANTGGILNNFWNGIGNWTG